MTYRALAARGSRSWGPRRLRRCSLPWTGCHSSCRYRHRLCCCRARRPAWPGCSWGTACPIPRAARPPAMRAPAALRSWRVGRRARVLRASRPSAGLGGAAAASDAAALPARGGAVAAMRMMRTRRRSRARRPRA
eukprot:scaffold2119_cov355-Prasinococcus_capsulatus_cf.AAC.7